MPQPTTAPSAPATTAPSAPAAQPPAPAANITRTDGVVGGNAPATGTQSGTLQPSGTGTAPAQQQPGGLLGGGMMMLLFLPLAGLMIYSMMSSRKESKKRADLMASLQRNDKVQTIGGVIGTIAEINDNEIVLKADEITNTRIRVSRSAISSVLNRSSKPDGLKVSV